MQGVTTHPNMANEIRSSILKDAMKSRAGQKRQPPFAFSPPSHNIEKYSCIQHAHHINIQAFAPKANEKDESQN